jgi:hypothetical protein
MFLRRAVSTSVSAARLPGIAHLRGLFAICVGEALVRPLLSTHGMSTPAWNRLPTRPEIWVDALTELYVRFEPHLARCAIGVQIVLASGATVA